MKPWANRVKNVLLPHELHQVNHFLDTEKTMILKQTESNICNFWILVLGHSTESEPIGYMWICICKWNVTQVGWHGYGGGEVTQSAI